MCIRDSYSPTFTKEQAIDFGVESPIDSGAEWYKAWSDVLGFGAEYWKNIKELEFDRQVLKVKTDRRLADEEIARKKEAEKEARAEALLAVERQRVDLLRRQLYFDILGPSSNEADGLSYFEIYLQRGGLLE